MALFTALGIYRFLLPHWDDSNLNDTVATSFRLVLIKSHLIPTPRKHDNEAAEGASVCLFVVDSTLIPSRNDIQLPWASQKGKSVTRWVANPFVIK